MWQRRPVVASILCSLQLLLISLMQIATLIRGFVMIRLLMHIVLVMKERKICLTRFLQFVILSPPLCESSHLPMSSLATKWYGNVRVGFTLALNIAWLALSKFRLHGVLFVLQQVTADPSDRAVNGVAPLPLACWNCGFESRQGMDDCLLCVVR